MTAPLANVRPGSGSCRGGILSLGGELGPLELWAGVECTVNRVGDRWFDQVERTGHANRATDLERLAELGVRAVRYPVLWERTAPSNLAEANWSWADARLARLRRLGIRVIVGLVHHGSGPAHTSLVDDAFPDKLAEFARAVAERYPWIEDFTPVNEPLTTARFSGLYGLWYPHGRNETIFAKALLLQCRAIVHAMRAIREVTPNARLVQTEDMGTIFSTSRLAYQAAFENERRWLSLDLLAGMVTREHGWWKRLLGAGVPQRWLDGLRREPCAPDLIGINYYVTSDRFLDERLERYPRHTHGGNGRDEYADVEAVRVRGEGIVGHCARLEEAWARYHRPLALTEAHMGCTREEQLRWLRDAWQGAERARGYGCDVRAVTLWSAFGAVDWDTLLVRDQGHYEPGAYDVRAPVPRATALAGLARDLADSGAGSNPVIDQPGWWQTERRLTYPVVGDRLAVLPPPSVRPIVIAGAAGTLGRAFARECERRGIAHHLLSRSQMDIAEPDAIARELESRDPWAVINAAGYSRVDEAEHDPSRCHRENTWGAAALADQCRRRHVALVTFSSDLVFDGSKGRAYVESDKVSPLGVYGRSKARAEEATLDRWPSTLIVRTSACFGEQEERSFVYRAIEALSGRRAFPAPRDLVVSPTYIPDLVTTTLDLLIDGEKGIWHLTNSDAVNYAELAERAAALARLSTRSLIACSAVDLRRFAPRPPFSALASERGVLMPTLEDALGRYICGRQSTLAAAGAA